LLLFFAVQQIKFTLNSDWQFSKLAYLAVAVSLDKVTASRLVTLALSRRNIASSLAKKTSRYIGKNIVSFHTAT